MPTDEAVDLVMTLPRGSLWRSSRRPYGEWTEAEELAANVVDSINRLIQLHATGSTEHAQRTVRPSMLEEAEAERERARRAKEKIMGTTWEEA